jgi:hypothetical protein
MTNLTFFTNENGTEWVQIETAPNQFTSMTKETYDAQQASSTLPSNSSDPVEKPKK